MPIAAPDGDMLDEAPDRLDRAAPRFAGGQIGGQVLHMFMVALKDCRMQRDDAPFVLDRRELRA